jgi:hypothetical protein
MLDLETLDPIGIFIIHTMLQTELLHFVWTIPSRT